MGPVTPEKTRRIPPGETLDAGEDASDDDLDHGSAATHEAWLEEALAPVDSGVNFSGAVGEELFEPMLPSVCEEGSADPEDFYEAPRPLMVAFGLSDEATFVLGASAPCFVADFRATPGATLPPARLQRCVSEPATLGRGRAPAPLSVDLAEDATNIPMVPRANSWPGRSEAGFLPRLSMHLCSQEAGRVEHPPCPPGGSSPPPRLFTDHLHRTAASTSTPQQKEVKSTSLAKLNLFGMVSDLLDGALSGVATESFGDVDPHYAAALGLPKAASLRLCARRSFARQLCVSEAPGEEPFPVDCLPPSAPVAAAAPPPTPLRELARSLAASAGLEAGPVRPPSRRDDRLRARPSSGGRSLTPSAASRCQGAGDAASPTSRPPRLRLPTSPSEEVEPAQPPHAPRLSTAEAKRSSSSAAGRRQRPPSNWSGGAPSNVSAQKEVRSLFGASAMCGMSALAMDLGEEVASGAGARFGGSGGSPLEAGMVSFTKTSKVVVRPGKGGTSLPPVDGTSDKARRLLPVVAPASGNARARGCSWRVDLGRESRAPGIF